MTMSGNLPTVTASRPKGFAACAGSSRDRVDTLAAIAGQGAGFRSLGDTWADTTTPHGRLMLTVLGGLAEFERELIRARTSEGRARAVANGVKLGRKPKLTAHQKREAIKRRDAGDATRDIARSYNVSHSTISRLNFGTCASFQRNRWLTAKTGNTYRLLSEAEREYVTRAGKHAILVGACDHTEAGELRRQRRTI
jgi:Resolvase, N terminal domain/Helix-turn-helix domain of resolvase